MNKYLWNPYIEKMISKEDGKTLVHSYITGADVKVPPEMASSHFLFLEDSIGEEMVNNGLMLHDGEDAYKEYQAFRDLNRFSSRILDVTMHLNYDCNLRCPYCYQNTLPKNVIMSESQIVNSVAEIKSLLREKSYSQLSLTLIGGEPAMHPNLVQLLAKELSSINTPISGEVVTNGTLLTDEYIALCSSIGVNLFDITVDGMKNVHDSLRMHADGSGSFDKIISNILHIQNNFSNIEIIINYNLSEQSANHVEEFCAYLKEVGYEGMLSFSLIFDPPESSFKGAPRNHELVWKNANEIAAYYGFVNKPFYRSPNLFCPMYDDSAYFIDPKGEIWSCINGIGKNRYKQGAFNKRNTWHQMSLRAKRVEGINNPKMMCKECKFLPVCTGGCTYLNEEEHFRCLKYLYEHNEVPLLREQLNCVEYIETNKNELEEER